MKIKRLEVSKRYAENANNVYYSIEMNDVR